MSKWFDEVDIFFKVLQRHATAMNSDFTCLSSIGDNNNSSHTRTWGERPRPLRASKYSQIESDVLSSVWWTAYGCSDDIFQSMNFAWYELAKGDASAAYSIYNVYCTCAHTYQASIQHFVSNFCYPSTTIWKYFHSLGINNIQPKTHSHSLTHSYTNCIWLQQCNKLLVQKLFVALMWSLTSCMNLYRISNCELHASWWHDMKLCACMSYKVLICRYAVFVKNVSHFEDIFQFFVRIFMTRKFIALWNRKLLLDCHDCHDCTSNLHTTSYCIYN